MAERFSSDLLFIVIVLLIAAILGFLIGYFLRKRKAAEEMKSAEPVGADESANILTASAETHEIIEKVNYDTAVAEEIMETEIGLNDLKIIEGIGPKIESLLRRSSIDTWKKLADGDAEKISEMLVDEGGDRYKMHDPTTWSKQAQLAHEGKWQELKDLQDELQGGRPG
jgi:predicted flap endonuclease-1-like 5' DNA nuclease